MTTKERQAKVYHADLWGLREDKYTWLSEHDWETSDWQKLHPHSEFYLFVPRDEAVLERYQKFIKVTEIFPVSSTGIKTHRDHFVIDFDRNTLKRRIQMFLDPGLPDDMVRTSFKLRDNRDWKMVDKRKSIQNDKAWDSKTVPYFYRPFDIRWLFYHYDAVDFGRENVMYHILHENIALVTCRQQKGVGFRHAFVTDVVGDGNAISLHTREYNCYFPLYLYITPEDTAGELSPASGLLRKTNLARELTATINRELTSEGKLTEKASDIDPRNILHYIYAVLYSIVYRERYAEFLRIDFPRVPFTKGVKLFQKLAALGERLVDLHLLRSSELDPPIARFQGEGDNRVQTGKKGLRYDAEAQRVYINEEQFFEGVPAEVWEYPIGGYQVCHKWLKDRKDRCLSLEEIKTYCRIVTALSKTIEIQADIDTLYPQVEKTLLPIHLESE